MQRENSSPVYRALSSARAALVPWAEDKARARGPWLLVAKAEAEAEAPAYQADRARGPWALVATMATKAHGTKAEAHGGLPTAEAKAGQPTAGGSRPFQVWHPLGARRAPGTRTRATGSPTRRPGAAYMVRPAPPYTAASRRLHGPRPAPPYTNCERQLL